MSKINLNTNSPRRPVGKGYASGRLVASTELRLRVGMADVQTVLEVLGEHIYRVLTPGGDMDLVAYRDRINEVRASNHDLTISVERLTALLGRPLRAYRDFASAVVASA